MRPIATTRGVDKTKETKKERKTEISCKAARHRAKLFQFDQQFYDWFILIIKLNEARSIRQALIGVVKMKILFKKKGF